jgi:Ca-activated chloride channel family protein
LNCGKGTVDDTDQVPDASRISPPRIDQMHPDAARLSLLGKLDGRDVDLCSISSPTHPTAVRPVGGDFEIFLPNNAAVPDRDFVLRWRRAALSDLLPVAWISSDQEETYALIQLRAPDDVPTETREGSDIYFLVDRSGSMAGEKWAKTAEALIAFVKATAQRDRVWVTFFESDYRDVAEKPMERDEFLRDSNFQSIADLGTGGGTELVPALRHILGIHQRFSTRRRSHIVLITDGQVGNEEAVLEEISGHAIPVHCFGIDHAVNEAFLRQLSGQQRGTSVFLTPDDDLVRPVAILGSRLSRPVFTGLTLHGGWESADTELPDIHSGQVVFAPIRTKDNLSDITVAGQDAAGRPLTVTLQAQAAETDLPKLIWMKRRIDSLLQDSKDEEAIELAKKANLTCRGAAFIAWDDAEKVAIAQDEVYQPSLDVPSGLLYAKRRASSSDSASFFLACAEPEYQKAAVLAPCSNEELVSDIFDLKETKSLTEQVNRAIESVFCPLNATKLADIVRDWSTNTDEKQVRDALCVLLQEWEHDSDAEHLRKVLADFFLALPDPWKTRARPIFAAQSAKIWGATVSP